MVNIYIGFYTCKEYNRDIKKGGLIMLVTMKEILDKASREGYGVVAPNVINESTARACIDAAEELRAPLILDVAYPFHPDIVFLGRMLEEMAIRATVPIAINLDHGSSFEQALYAIRAGFTSVMVDRSTLSLEENIKQTKEIVKIAHAVNVSVEAELGHVGDGAEYEKEGKAYLTDPQEALLFYKETGIDALAISVGTAHGVYSGIPTLDFGRIQAIHDLLPIPLVLHGGSGSGDENLVKAINCGITKINIATDNFAAAVEYAKNPGEDYLVYHRMQEGFKETVKKYMRLFNQTNRV